jgi:hypothetical protein
VKSKDRYTSIKVIPFNGKKNEWSWEEKYLIRAKHKGIKPILLDQKMIPVDDILLQDGSFINSKVPHYSIIIFLYYHYLLQ